MNTLRTFTYFLKNVSISFIITQSYISLHICTYVFNCICFLWIFYIFNSSSSLLAPRKTVVTFVATNLNSPEALLP